MEQDPFDSDGAFPRLGADVLEVLDAAGARRPLVAGEVLFRAGDAASDFFVVLRGRVAIVDAFGTPAERVVGVHGDLRFVGELNLVTGQPAFLTAVVEETGEAIVLSRDELQAVVSANQRLGDVIVNAFIARRSLLIGLGSGLRLVGSHLAPDTRRLREFLTRNRIPHSFLDLETDAQADRLLRWMSIAPRDTPLVLGGSLALRNPSNAEVAAALHLRAATASPDVCDLVVVGAGPAGLGTAVYAASEGLSTVLVDSVALGGQASTSARIENYLGFPAGISGSELAERAAVQASRFGARSAVPETARGLSFEDGHHVVELDRGERLRARTVVIATGASYRRLRVANLPEFEGAGVYYAATLVEAQMCGGAPVVVVGGGNSAGQAAVFLARHVSRVDLVVRGADLGAGMSRYLVDQVEASPRIELHLHAELRALLGDGALEAVTVQDTRAGTTRTVPVSAAFVFIGADPCTAWLGDAVATDDDGFVVTGDDLRLSHLDPAGDGRQRAPFPLETSRPGVFAVGDVRSRSIKRVASAVGEGAMAVMLLHRYLALLDAPSPIER
ncbi:MAG: thioredoxin reductase [Solirubrobacteraceae bacterium]|jgi:thioredoxin reductase (NADPH)|nr:thioredoxin reductase [Solirubrobacteraceae bacterium]